MDCERLQAGSRRREGGAGMSDVKRSTHSIVARLIDEANGRLMRGSDPRLIHHQNKTGESAGTDSPANPNTTHPSNGDTNNGKAQ